MKKNRDRWSKKRVLVTVSRKKNGPEQMLGAVRKMRKTVFGQNVDLALVKTT